jgi:hypothetical protein
MARRNFRSSPAKEAIVKALALGCALACTVVAPSLAQDRIIELFGPAAVNEPVLGNIGENALIAFFEKEDGKCAVNIVTWFRSDTEAKSASRTLVSLNPEQKMYLQSINENLALQPVRMHRASCLFRQR